MKNAKFLLLLLPIALVVLTSGCTGGGGPQLGNGVTILNFEPDFSSVESGDEIRLYLQIQNLGEEQADNVIARITGIDSVELGKSETEHNFYSLIPPNTEYGTEGETAQYYFEMAAPMLPEGQTVPYNPKVRIYYDYKTSATKQITLVAEDELRRLMQQGKSLPTGETHCSSGPISVNVVTGKYIKAKTGGQGYYFPITITLNNMGGGVVSEYKTGEFAEPEDYKINMMISLPGSGLSVDDCSAESIAGGYKATLWKGASATITCRFNIDSVPLIAEQKTLGIDLQYPYYIDSSTSFSVKGRAI